MHHFIASDPGLSHLISVQNLHYGCLSLMLAEKVSSIVSVETNCYHFYQHNQGQKNKIWQPDLIFDEVYHFIALMIGTL
jgi:hypothetical protein